MNDLSAWLQTQIAEDERLAKAATPGPWQWDGDAVDTVAQSPDYIARYRWVSMSDSDTEGVLAVNGEHIAAWDPARVLAECEAKRKLIDRYERAVAAAPSAVSSYVRGQDYGYREACLDAIQDEAAVYAAMGRPGYREEWPPL